MRSSEDFEKASSEPDVAEYDLAFGKKLAEIAESTVAGGLMDVASRRAVAYLGRLSLEISMKALLEQAGFTARDIRAKSHRLSEIMNFLGTCEVQEDPGDVDSRWVPAVRIRAISIDAVIGNATVGAVVDAELHGASTYPNQIRYGNDVRDFPPEAIANAATKVATWAQQHWDSIRKSASLE